VDVRTSQEAQIPTAFSGESFTHSYVDDVRTSQEARIWTSMACYGDCLTFKYADDVRTSQEAQILRPFTGTPLLFYM
jgi:hypothetical protein